MKPLIYTTLFTLSFAALSAAATIGTITSSGRFELEGATIWNQGTMLEGARVATGTAASRLQFSGGTDLRLGAASHARVYADRLLLESGSVQGHLPANFRMETATLGLRVEGAGAQAQIKVNDRGNVIVASLTGSLAVRNPQGVLLAQLQEGNAVELSSSQGGATASTKLTGKLKNKDGKYFLTDEVTGVTAELHGADLAKYAGKRIYATGNLDAASTPAAGAEYVVQVQLIELPDDDPDAAAVLLKKGGTLSPLAKVGIVGGIAVAGGVTAGVVAAGEDSQQTVSPQP
ncbi:MAG: hypothetical protein U5J83_01750 [Bryobacterales bacterium]|nr:hypothetical protein [Bryobacterales bacterium]